MSQTSNEVTEAYLALGEKLKVIEGAYDQALVALKEAREQRDVALNAQTEAYVATDKIIHGLRVEVRDLRNEVVRIREYLGAMPEENTLGPVKRVVVAKDKADMEKERADAFRRQLDTSDSIAAKLRSILGHPNVNLEEAARLVVQERDEAKALRDAALKTRDAAISDRDTAREALSDLRACLDEVRIHLKVPERENVAVWAQHIAEKLHTEESEGPTPDDSLRVGDFVAVGVEDAAERNAWGTVLSTQGRVTVYYPCEGVFYYSPEELKRKPADVGCTVRCIGGLNKGHTGRIDGIIGGEARVVTDGHDLAKAFWTNLSNLVAVSL